MPVKAVAGLVVLLLGVQTAAWAADDKPSPEVFRALEEQLTKLTGVPQAASKPLPELKGVVSWKTLAQVSVVRQKDRFVPEFSKDVAMLDRKEVKLQGFMMPLEVGARQKRFLLTAMPPGCAFCMPGGPDQVVEVAAKVGVKHDLNPVIVSGKFVLVRDDSMGLFYRLTEAVAVAR